MPTMTDRDDATYALGSKTTLGIVSVSAALRKALARLIIGGPA